MAMLHRRLLLLDANRLTAYLWRNGRLSEEQAFGTDTATTEVFAKYLSDHDRSIFSLLVDVAEEGFEIENVPFVRGKDRAALTRRRLAQYFYGTPFTLAASLGREKTGRRDEKILFAALSQSRHMAPWLATIRTMQIRLAGIYSAPQTLATLSSTQRKSGPRLVLSMTRSGVRQTFFNDGKMYFSRLIMLATGTIDEAAVACAMEAQQMYQYLAGQRLIDRDATLKVSLLANPAEFEILRAHCRSSAELAFDYIDLLAEAKTSKLKTAIPDSRCEWLMLHQLARRPPGEQFAPPEERRFYHLWQFRSGLAAAGIVIFCACLLYAGKQYRGAHSLGERTYALRQETAQDQRKYETALKTLPSLLPGTEHMRTLATRFEDLSRRSPPLEATLVPLSRALDATVGIELLRISWQLSSELPPATEAVTGISRQQPLGVSSSYAIADIDAQLPIELRNDHRAMRQLIDQFVATLSKEKSFSVAQLGRLPSDADSGKIIKSSDEASPDRAEPPKFSFRLVQGL